MFGPREAQSASFWQSDMGMKQAPHPIDSPGE
jgi:hypothetical protein